MHVVHMIDNNGGGIGDEGAPAGTAAESGRGEADTVDKFRVWVLNRNIGRQSIIGVRLRIFSQNFQDTFFRGLVEHVRVVEVTEQTGDYEIAFGATEDVEIGMVRDRKIAEKRIGG